MSPQQPQVSLPSINELLPEFMMQNWYAESRERSTVEPSRSDTIRGFDRPASRATNHHDAKDAEPRWHAGADYPSAQDHSSYSRLDHDQRAQSGVSHPFYEPRPPYSANPYSPTAGLVPGPDSSSPSTYSLDVLRPHPLTANLENVASSTDVAAPPRIPHTPGLSGGAAAAGPTVSSVQKVRPSFRVQIPPMISSGHDIATHSAPSLYHVSPVSAPPARGIDYDMLASPIPQAYPADPYFSPQIPTIKQQNLYRIQSHSSAAHNVEEKKHCCPHCNKRFNRPSSLNIHVNTHTGAKPFQCPYPGCNRKFNVNSNMRRHWRNHLSASRSRRDSVTQMPEIMPSLPPTPPLTASAASSPRSRYTHSLPSSISSAGSSAPYDSRSPTPQLSESELGDDDGDVRMRVDLYRRRPDVDSPTTLRTVCTRPIHPLDVSNASTEVRLDRDVDVDGLRWRQRSRSSPVPRYHESMGPARQPHGTSGSRARSNSCNVPGCDCRPMPSLRPAFPSSSVSAPSQGRSH